MYGLRNVTPFAIGASHVSRSRFLLLNAIGAVVWSITVAWGGYLFGKAFQHFFDDIKRYELYVFGGLVVLGLVIWLISRIHRRRKAQRALQPPEKPKPAP